MNDTYKYKSIAIQIIEQAVRDYQEYTEKYYKSKKTAKKQKYLNELENIIDFINSSWFDKLNYFSEMNIKKNELFDELEKYFEEYGKKIEEAKDE